MITTEQLTTMSMEELKTLQAQVNGAIKIKRSIAGNITASQLSPGDKVKAVEQHEHEGSWTVEKLNRTRAVLKRDSDGKRYNVPFNMIII